MAAEANGVVKRRTAGIAGDLRFRRLVSRAALIVLLVGGAYLVYVAATARLESHGIGTGFGFLLQEAGFAIGETVPIPVPVGSGAWLFSLLAFGALAGFGARALVGGGDAGWPRVAGTAAMVLLAAAAVLAASGRAGIAWVSYTPDRSFAFALLTGFANTIKACVFGCLLATVVGVSVGIARLSTNWLVARSATAFVESLRNVPLLIQIFFWYFGVLRALPSVRQSLDIMGFAALNNRGIYLPEIHSTPGSWPGLLALALGIAGLALLRRRALAIKLSTGSLPAWSAAAPLVLVGAPALAWLAFGPPATLSVPVLEGFNFVGGVRMSPEFGALLLGLGFYHAAFIAEIVRGGVQGVDHGQREAARALGLREGRILRLVVFPQALKVMFPPLITEYLSLIKDSSLGFAIAFPELVTINNVTINQTGQPIEVLTITIAVFMAFNLLVALILNRFERTRAWTPM